MTVLEALAITRNPSADYDSFVVAVMVLYANLEGGKALYHCHETGQRVYFELVECEKDYLRCQMISDGKDPDEEGLSDYFGD